MNSGLHFTSVLVLETQDLSPSHEHLRIIGGSEYMLASIRKLKTS